MKLAPCTTLVLNHQLMLAVLALVFAVPVAHAKNDFKIGGRLGLGFAVDEEDGTEDVFEMRLATQTKREEGLKALVELRADDGSRDVRIHDAFADWKEDSDRHRVRFGRGKKILGWEYEYSTARRLTISRTLAYRQLSRGSIVGRDYFVAYNWYDTTEAAALDASSATSAPAIGAERAELDSMPGDPGQMVNAEERWQLGFAAHYTENKDIGFVLSALTSLSETFRAGLWLNRQFTRTPGTGIHTHQGVLSFLFEPDVHRAELELFAGQDPIRQLAERRLSGDRRVRFAAAKLGYGLFLGRLNPYVVGTRMIRDLSHSGDRTDEYTLGLRLYLSRKLSVAGETSLQSSRSEFDATTMPYERTSASVIARYFF